MTLIRPILCYRAQVWGFSNPVQEERVHLQFCEKLLGVKKATQNDFVYSELRKVPLKNDIFIRLSITGLRRLHSKNLDKSNRKAMNRNRNNQKANPALKTKTGNK